MSIDFLLVYESKIRELESICLLSVLLEKRGYTTKMINVYSYAGLNNKKIDVNTIVIPFLYSNNDLAEYVFSICKSPVRVVNLRWEQIYSPENELNFDS